MNPARKRTVRLVVALSAAVVLASALDLHELQRREPRPDAEPAHARGAARAQLPGHRHRRPPARCIATGEVLHFSVEDRAGGTTIPLSYTGTVPDPFREGREVIVTVQKQGARLRRRTQLADHEVPVQVQDGSGRREPERLSARRRGMSRAGARR